MWRGEIVREREEKEREKERENATLDETTGDIMMLGQLWTDDRMEVGHDDPMDTVLQRSQKRRTR